MVGRDSAILKPEILRRGSPNASIFKFGPKAARITSLAVGCDALRRKLDLASGLSLAREFAPFRWCDEKPQSKML